VSSSRGAELTLRFRNALLVAALFHGSQFREGGKSVILGPDHKTQLAVIWPRGTTWPHQAARCDWFPPSSVALVRHR
jgi:hypothetical protein